MSRPRASVSLGVQQLDMPLSLILDEHLHAVGSGGDRPLERAVQPAGDGHVGAETSPGGG